MTAAASAQGPAGRAAAARFLDPRVLARIGNLDLVARTVIDGFVSGQHRATFRGISTDFAEHRAYVPGDDVRFVDWRVYARTDRLYVRTFEAETNADLVLALDVSRSMDFGAKGLAKLDYARFLLASLAHLAGRQRDKVGLVAFDSGLVDVVPPSVRHRDEVLRHLERLRPGGPGDLAAAMRRVGDGLHRRGIVVVVSDFYVAPEDAASALDGLRVRGHDVIALQVLDPVEIDLELEGAEVLEDLETGERLPVSPQALAGEYRRLVEDHGEALRARLGERRVDFSRFDTAAPLDHALFAYLAGRARLARVR